MLCLFASSLLISLTFIVVTLSLCLDEVSNGVLLSSSDGVIVWEAHTYIHTSTTVNMMPS